MDAPRDRAFGHAEDRRGVLVATSVDAHEDEGAAKRVRERVDAEGERFVLMGRNREKETLLGDYRFPGGGVDNDASPLVAVLKEVYEETGVNLRKMRAADLHLFTASNTDG